MLYVCTRMYERESTARRHSSTAKAMKMKPKLFGKKKILVPSRVIMSCLIGTPKTSQKEKKKKIKIKQQSFSQSRTPPAPLATVSQPIQFG